MPDDASNRVTGDCLIVQPIHAAGLGKLTRAGLQLCTSTATDAATLAREARHCVAVVTRNNGFPAQAVDAATSLRVIGVHGTDPMAVQEATLAGLAVVNTPGTNARSVAEHAVALILALAKRLPAADRAARAGNFRFKYSSRLLELHGRTLGLIGFGNIGHTRFLRLVETAIRDWQYSLSVALRSKGHTF